MSYYITFEVDYHIIIVKLFVLLARFFDLRCVYRVAQKSKPLSSIIIKSY